MFFAILAHLEEIYWQKVKLAKSSWLPNSSVFPGVAKFLTPNNIFFQRDPFGPGDACRKELNDPLKNPMFLPMLTAGEFQYIFIKVTLKNRIFKK